jgi:PAS domain S-box-containing protein
LQHRNSSVGAMDNLKNVLTANKLILAGLGLAIAYWFAEAVVLDVLVFREGTVTERLLLLSELHEFWHRLVAVIVFVVVGVIAQYLVDKRRRAQEKQAELAVIVESSDEAIIGATLDGTVTSWNPAAEKLFGYSVEEMVGRSVSVLIPPDRRREFSENLEKVRQGRSVSIDETVQVTRDGERVWTSVSLSPIRDLNGNVTGTSTIAHDITEQKRTREELRRQKELYETLLNAQSEMGVGFLIAEGQRIIYANEAYCRITGYGAEELRAMPSFIETLVTPEERPLVRERLRRRLSREDVPEHYETAILDKSGQQLDLEVSLKMPRRETGAQVVGIVRDITERKRAERELEARTRQQAAVAQLGQRALRQSDLSVLMDEAVDLTAKTLNVEYCELLEFLPEGDTLLLRAGVGWKDGFVGQVTAEADLNSQVGYTLLFSEPVVVADLREEKRFSGTPLLLEHGVVSGMSVVIQGRGRPYGVLGAHTREHRQFSADDINFLRAVANVLAVAIERARAEEALLKVQEDERRRIARDLHDLVMQDLTDALQALRATQLRSENLGQGVDLEREIDALQRTVKGLRGAIYDLRSEEGGSFIRAVTSQVELERQMAPECDIEVAVDEGFPAGLPEEVKTELLRILQEALTNARRHSASRHVWVTLRLDGDEVMVEVVDDGRGFDPEAARGGVGLAGMRERALALGGRLEVESQPGEGTKVQFKASLPSLLGIGLDLQGSPELPYSDGEQAGEAVGVGARGKRLLLVEDHVSFRQSLATTLKSRSDFTLVAQVGSLAGAREVIAQFGDEIDIAIVDLSLPDGSGTELIRELHDANPQATVLMLTASLDRQQYAWSIEAGAAGVLHKSASIDSIFRALRRLSAGEPLLPPSEVVELLRLALRQREQDQEAKSRLRLLTPRELEVLQLLAEGLDGREIARRLEITVKTEHTHMTSIFNKLGLHSRLEALVFAVRHGLVDLPSSSSAWKGQEEA